MPDLFIYLIKVNVALLIFCAGYYAVLRHLTFYNLNRIYLVTAIIFSTLYPLLDLSAFLNSHKDIARPVQVVIVNWQGPVKSIAKTFLGHDIWFWLLAAFWTGVVLFAIRLMMQLLSLYKLHKRSEPVQLHQYMIRVIEGDINPFSFWRNIYVNPKNHHAQELDAILEHEQIHVNEWHTLDILLGEVSAIFYWFNPGVWLMKRAIRENIEFITDNKILMKGVDCKAYQYSLLSVNMAAEGNALVNHFNISTIKKRIIMMNAKRSSTVNITRYLFLVPAVMVLLMIFSVSKADIKKVAKTGEHMMKTISVAVKEITLTGEPAALPATRKVKLLPPATSHGLQTDDLTYETGTGHNLQLNFLHFTAVSDTVKKEGFNITRFFADGAQDTTKNILKIRVDGDEKPVIYIDGVKTEISIDNVNPENISSVAVMKDGAGAGKGAVYITTKGHEIKAVAGTMIIDTVRGGIRNRIDGVRIVNRAAAGIQMSSANGMLNVTTASKPMAIRLNGRTVPANERTTTGYVVNGDSVYTSNIRITGRTVVKPDSALRDVVVTGYPTRAVMPAKILNVISMRDANNAINFTDKLVIIDGKESTEKELKKISLDKIESVSTLKADAAADKYGDKGKNGAVVIKTKK